MTNFHIRSIKLRFGEYAGKYNSSIFNGDAGHWVLPEISLDRLPVGVQVALGTVEIDLSNFIQAALAVVDPGFTALAFDFDNDPERLEYMGRIYSATTDLGAFKKAGGKILCC